MPLFLKWALVYEHPDEHSLFLGRATPRSLAPSTPGQPLAVHNVPTRYGRVGFTLACVPSLSNCTANVSIPDSWAQADGGGPSAWRPPPGGLYLRVRLPGGRPLVGAQSSSGWRPTPLFHGSECNVTRDCVWFSPSWLSEKAARTALQNITLWFDERK